MDRSFKRFLAVMLLTLAICGGFRWGQNVGAAILHGHALTSRYWPRVLSANAGGGVVGDADYPVTQDAASGVPPSDIFETVLDHVQRDFVEGSGNNLKLSNGALARMFASLNDPNTYFLDAPLRQARQESLQGRFYGIGAVLTTVQTKIADVDYRYLTVVDVMPGSPAEKAGMKSGDHITEVNGHWIIAYSPKVDIDRLDAKIGAKNAAQPEDPTAANAALDQIAKKFEKGYTLPKALPFLIEGEGKSLTLTVERPGTPTPRKVDLTTALTRVEPVEYRLLGKQADKPVGYLRVRQFNRKATEAFQTALNQSPKVKGMIVDLRDNPGGVQAEADTGVDGYDSALRLIARLTHGGTVASIERHPNLREPLVVKSSSQTVSLPIIVLVDQGTANLSELVASALRGVGKARIIGAHTFGDSVLQLFAVLKNGSGVEMAHAHLLTSAGVDLKKGIEPDIAVAANDAGGDTALKRALAALGTGA